MLNIFCWWVSGRIVKQLVCGIVGLLQSWSLGCCSGFWCCEVVHSNGILALAYCCVVNHNLHMPMSYCCCCCKHLFPSLSPCPFPDCLHHCRARLPAAAKRWLHSMKAIPSLGPLTRGARAIGARLLPTSWARAVLVSQPLFAARPFGCCGLCALYDVWLSR